jgi:heat shock protein HslJ
MITAVGALTLWAAPAVADAGLSDLYGTGWQLVEIASMNDTVARPDEASSYRLLFGIDGSVSALADCNLASGAVAVWDPPRLQFSGFAGTMAACGPGSLGARYLTELGSVRSYMYREGRLYLATMAEGSVIEFVPLPVAEAAATVGRLSLIADNADALRGIVLSRLLDDYASNAGITVSDAEVAAYQAAMQTRLLAEFGDDFEDGSSLREEERAEIDRMRRRMAEALIRQWKINRALHREYGGRIIYQQLGPEPLDAYETFLEEARERERFTIQHADLAELFWAYFRDDQRHSFMLPGSEDEARAFETPPWVPAE